LCGHFVSKSVSDSATNGLASLAFRQKCSKICSATHIGYCQRQKCSAVILVSSKVRLVWIFARVHWRWASNESVVVENGDYSLLWVGISSELSHPRPQVLLARDSMLSALYAIARPSVRPSVRLSVCLFVTRVDQSKTVDHAIFTVQ